MCQWQPLSYEAGIDVSVCVGGGGMGGWVGVRARAGVCVCVPMRASLCCVLLDRPSALV